jgi:hypothetical protein
MTIDIALRLDATRMPPNIVQLQHKLRLGVTPEVLGLVELGRGVQKAAYLYQSKLGGRYIVKLNTGGFGQPEKKSPPNLRKYGVENIRQFLAGPYIIQELVTPLSTRENHCNVPQSHNAWKILGAVQWHEQRGDYHPGNFGIRANGELVCFDW